MYQNSTQNLQKVIQNGSWGHVGLKSEAYCHESIFLAPFRSTARPSWGQVEPSWGQVVGPKLGEMGTKMRFQRYVLANPKGGQFCIDVCIDFGYILTAFRRIESLICRFSPKQKANFNMFTDFIWTSAFSGHF